MKKTYPCNMNDISINDTLNETIQNCASYTLVGVLQDPLGLNTADIWNYNWNGKIFCLNKIFFFYESSSIDSLFNS